MALPWFDAETAASFAEVFLDAEYAPALARSGLPARWLDLGCYAGFFSMWVARRRMEAGLEPGKALLVDADDRRFPYIRQAIRINGLEERFKLLRGAVAGGSGKVVFAPRAYMASALAEEGDASASKVSILSDDALCAGFPPPYDLVKLDVEGAEAEFFDAYPKVLAGARFVVAEWHSWHRAGDGLEGLTRLAAGRGFSLLAEIAPARPVLHLGRDECCGIALFGRVGKE